MCAKVVVFLCSKLRHLRPRSSAPEPGRAGRAAAGLRGPHRSRAVGAAWAAEGVEAARGRCCDLEEADLDDVQM